MTPPIPLLQRVLNEIRRCRKRNEDLRKHLLRARRSRDKWRLLAGERRLEIKKLRARVEHPKRPGPKPRKDPLTLEQFRTHHRIVRRILAIPPRDPL